ncbi:hypothetical protein [Kitasatospora cinereorecta]|uniref:Uncharacterized protein n=1 Tax=Kitasatospora cinereorecta TaxID=285560 RepID=A0ABW0VP15_9ACTN
MPPRSRKQAKAEAVIAALGDTPEAAELAEFVRGLAAPAEPANPNVAIRANAERVDRVKDKAESSGETVTAVLSRGIQRFLDGDLLVDQPARARRGAGGNNATLNVRPAAELITRLKDHCTAAAGQLGWPIKPANVYAAILAEYDPAPPADDQADDAG